MLKKLATGLFSIGIGIGVLLAANSVDNAKERVTERLQEFTEIFNKGNLESLPSFLTEDAEFINPVSGETIRGREAIVHYFQDRLQEFQGKKAVFNEGQVDFPEPNRAIVQGVVQITDQENLVGRRARKIELIRQNGEWYVEAINEIDVEVPPALYERLK